MQIPLDKLAHRLEGGLAPVYVVCGDEPLQNGEAADAIRAACRAQGVSERIVFDVDARFDWNRLAEAGDALSLFAERRLLELRLTGGPGQAGGKALQAYAAKPVEHDVLLITSPRIDRKAQASAWFRALDKCGAIVQVWPVDRQQFPRWLQRRAAGLELELGVGAARLLAERVENNMLAAAQELEKLRLIAGAGTVDEDAVLRGVADSARFTVFDLGDAMLAGDCARVVRVLHGLREEGVENVLVLWSVARELRTLAQAGAAIARGASEDDALSRANVWARRKGLVSMALRRRGPWRRLLVEAARADRAIKGGGGDADAMLETLALRVAGAPLALASAGG